MNDTGISNIDLILWNRFSYWFPKIKDCGIKVPETFFMELPSVKDGAGNEEYNKGVERLYAAFYMENPKEDYEIVSNWVEKNVVPELKKLNLTGHIFVKNATFSNKFDARTSCNLYGLSKLSEALININYAAACVGADGETEIVVRKFIESNRSVVPCIYNGLPLRPEFRLFYDFDKHEVVFTVNYWDYDYCYPNLYDATDKIIFEHEREKLEAAFKDNKEKVEELVATHMKNNTELKGQWSVDILMDEEGEFWLIDMAVAQRSAYWEKRPNKSVEET